MEIIGIIFLVLWLASVFVCGVVGIFAVGVSFREIRLTEIDIKKAADKRLTHKSK